MIHRSFNTELFRVISNKINSPLTLTDSGIAPLWKVFFQTMPMTRESKAARLFKRICFPHYLIAGRAPLCVAVEMLVNSNSGSGGAGEWMGPGYQGATMSLRLIKFSACRAPVWGATGRYWWHRAWGQPHHKLLILAGLKKIQHTKLFFMARIFRSILY